LAKKKVKFSASEMNTFIRYFGLMVGDYIPEDDPVWLYYLTLREILDFVSAPKVDTAALNYLKVLISEHHELYISLFKANLKPKHHFMLHYPMILLLNGPLMHVSSMRFESFHRLSRQASHAMNSRVNLILTLSIKLQLKLCARLMTRKPLIAPPEFGPGAFSSLSDLTGYQWRKSLSPDVAAATPTWGVGVSLPGWVGVSQPGWVGGNNGFGWDC
jgi:hypothetical protein